MNFFAPVIETSRRVLQVISYSSIKLIVKYITFFDYFIIIKNLQKKRCSFVFVYTGMITVCVFIVS